MTGLNRLPVGVDAGLNRDYPAEVMMDEEGDLLAQEPEQTPEAPETEPDQAPEPEGAAPEQPEDEPKPPKKMRGVGKRLHQLTTERDYWREQVEQAKQQPQEPKPPEPRKSLADFGYDEDKYASYVSDQAKADAAEVARAEVKSWSDEQQQKEALRRRQSFELRLAEFADDHPDFYDGWDETPISQPMADAIVESELAAEICNHLKNNQDVALKLARLSGPVAAREIGRIEERLVTEKAKAKEKSVSQAPSPPPKIEGSDPGNIERDPSKMTDDQFRKWRERTIARRSGRR